MTRLPRKGAWVLDWSAFPPTLHDQVLAEINRSMDDLLAGIFLRPLRESTKVAREYHYRVAASALACENVNPLSITSFEHLTSLEAYQKILGHLIKRHGGTAGGQIGHIAKLLQRTARDRCNAADEQLKRMSAMLKRVWKPQIGMTERNRARLWQFEDAAAVIALVKLPPRLAEEARRARSPREALSTLFHKYGDAFLERLGLS